MGNSSNVAPFVSTDEFLRRAGKKRHVKLGVVHWEVFADSHPTLSFTLRNDDLRTEDGLDRYQELKAFPSDDLPGICMLTFLDLTDRLRPALPPRRDPDGQDATYGHLHCSTDRPSGQIQMEVMAELANKHGVLREFILKRKRRQLRPDTDRPEMA